MHFYTHPIFAAHEMGSGHPESPARLLAIERALKQAGLWDRLILRQPRQARLEEIARAHTDALLTQLQASAPETGYAVLDADTSMNPASWPAALHAAGAVIEAVDAVLDGESRHAFCAVRPPGHHAERGRAMGFCLINHVAIGALHARDVRGLDRIAVIDFDVHHGNGTEAILADEPGMLMVSSFQEGIYPGTGREPLGANMLNLPLAGGSDGRALREIVTQVWHPALERFAPQLILISAGFDAHASDPLAGLGWLEDDYRWITKQLLQIARDHCPGRVVSTLEGGYELGALGRSVLAHLEELVGP